MFIVRIWREARESEGDPPEWRGSIEHVKTGERRYVKQLDEVVGFIAGYWRDETRISARRLRLTQWLTKWKRM